MDDQQPGRLPQPPGADRSTIWMAASGSWRVIQHVGRQRTLERLIDGHWYTYHEGTSSDQLLALAAATDDREGIPATDPNRPCWVNGTTQP